MLSTLLLILSVPLPLQEPDLGAEVRELFAAKCLECHHPESESRKAKREFDQAYDLRAVALEWGDDLEPDFAPLFEIAEDRSMPPEDSDFTPITEKEADLLKRWALARTPMPADGNPFVDMEMAAKYLQVDTVPQASVAERSLIQRLIILLGRLHSPMAHFPVALLLLAAFLRLGSKMRPPSATAQFELLCLWVGAPTAVVAAGLGWLNAANTGAGGDELFWHRWIGVGVAALSVLLLLLHKRAATKAWFGWALLFLGAAIAFGAHKGGVLVFGEDYFRI